jgi:hypothetical protein
MGVPSVFAVSMETFGIVGGEIVIRNLLHLVKMH